MFSSLFFNNPKEIIFGMKNIILSESILLSDYMAVANPGTAFFNSGLLMLLAIIISQKSMVNMNGTVIAAIFTVAGFAFFGKNIYNTFSIMIGVYIYAKTKNENFGKFLLIALFGTALGPMISQISFSFDLSYKLSLILANFFGIAAGFILPSLANHFIILHEGFNLYNIGFTAGIIGTLFMSLFRSVGLETSDILLLNNSYNRQLTIYLFTLFISIIIVGFLFNQNSFKGYKKLLKHTGRLVDDFVVTEGFGISLINMGLLGLVSTFYVLMIDGSLNGPVIGAIFTVVAFGAFGKHLKNVFPIMLGVVLASYFQIWELNSIGVILATLFGTTLAPIAGVFGWKSGVLAGFLHLALVMNVGYLHGGINLYNNGFSGGIIAAILVPVISSFQDIRTKSNKNRS